MSHHGQDGGWWESNIGKSSYIKSYRRRSSEEVTEDLKLELSDLMADYHELQDNIERLDKKSTKILTKIRSLNKIITLRSK